MENVEIPEVVRNLLKENDINLDEIKRDYDANREQFERIKKRGKNRKSKERVVKS